MRLVFTVEVLTFYILPYEFIKWNNLVLHNVMNKIFLKI